MTFISQNELKKILIYNRKTGMFYWKEKISKKTVVGKMAGCKNTMGYIVIGISGNVFYAHRLAYLYVYGEMPASIDHKDGDRANNKISNLRKCTTSQNILNAKLAKNNTSGFKGVSWHKSAGKWSAQYCVDNKSHHLGLFDCPELAAAAYIGAVSKIEPEFIRER